MNRIFQLLSSLTRKRGLSALIIVSVFLFFSNFTWAMEQAQEIMHPMMKPKMYSKNMSCPNCGMMINMWARTRHTFSNSAGQHETCSIRCLADLSNKAGEAPQNVMAASYLDPETMIPASEVIYIVGSNAKGTMTMKSKLAVSGEENAQSFINNFGGEKMDFNAAMKMAAMEADKTREKIQGNRLNKNKIVMTTPETSCTVCGMFPDKFPKHRSQITTEKGEHLHFCSTKCLVNYNSDPSMHIKNPQKTMAAWVTVYNDGDYEYANGLYYLVGSKIMGPMGPEAIPYRSLALAKAKAMDSGGKVVSWSELTPKLIKP